MLVRSLACKTNYLSVHNNKSSRWFGVVSLKPFHFRYPPGILLGTMPEKFRQATSETPLSPQEQFLRESLPTQFNTQTASLRAVGLLESIFKENTSADDNFVIELQEGITGMDGKAYALPTIEEIQKHFSQEKYAEKIDQGFTKLLIVPFAYPLATIRARYEQALLRHYKEGNLLDSRDGNRLNLDIKQPFYFDKIFDKSDETGDMIYYPKQFDTQNHGGFTKQELLDDPTQPFPGFHILLIKPDPILRKNSGRIIQEIRTDIGIGETPKLYLEILQIEDPYHKGTTLEDSITLALTNLHETNGVFDDFGDTVNSFSCNIGTFNKDSGDVPVFDWHSRTSQAYVSGLDPMRHTGACGCRTAVA